LLLQRCDTSKLEDAKGCGLTKEEVSSDAFPLFGDFKCLDVPLALQVPKNVKKFDDKKWALTP